MTHLLSSIDSQRGCLLIRPIPFLLRRLWTPRISTSGEWAMNIRDVSNRGSFNRESNGIPASAASYFLLCNIVEEVRDTWYIHRRWKS